VEVEQPHHQFVQEYQVEVKEPYNQIAIPTNKTSITNKSYSPPIYTLLAVNNDNPCDVHGPHDKIIPLSTTINPGTGKNKGLPFIRPLPSF